MQSIPAWGITQPLKFNAANDHFFDIENNAKSLDNENG